MIHSNYTKAILNALFHTTGAVGISAWSERTQLAAAGVDMINGVTAQAYFNAFKTDGYTTTGDLTAALNAKKALVNKSTWFYTIDTDPEPFEYQKLVGSTYTDFTVKLCGWTVEQRSNQKNVYPSEAHLALYTTMPDEYGAGYVEPSGDDCAYMRVDLFSSLISGGNSLNAAAADEVNGGAYRNNGEIIMYPEVYGVDWGTVVGFGIHDTSTVGEGTPIFWGRLTEPLETKTGHVVLFRADNFELTLR